MSAQKVSITTAANAAENFYAAKFQTKGNSSFLKARLANCYVSGGDTLMYVFNIANDGYVIISAEKSVSPVLAYSNEGNFVTENICPALSNWLEGYKQQISFAKMTKSDTENQEWEQFLSPTIQKSTKTGTKEVTPLLATKWDQGSGYNYHCPAHTSGPGGKCYAGCVATAMAQIMKYHNYPEKGIGSHSYQHPYYGTISADFAATTYDWASMTNSLNNNSKEAISTLIFHCGVSVEMYYTPTGSAAQTWMAKNALLNNFHYRNTIKELEKSSYSDLDWRRILMENLDDGYPILYSGSGESGGHAWVCDGYQDTLFHMNWGWSGANNGYFSVNDLNSGNGDFTEGQSAVINIIPYFAPYCRQNKIVSDTSGKISDGSAGSFYWNNTNCDWLIAPSDANKVILSFTDFRTEAGKDIVSVYDGESTSDPLLGTFSGQDLPPTLIANSGKMFITFNSDSVIQDYGWEGNFSRVTSGIDENSPGSSVIVFPVPANDKLNIVLGSSVIGSVIISVYNLPGQKLGSEKFTVNGDLSMEVGNLQKGIYFLEIVTDKYTVFKKFIKK